MNWRIRSLWLGDEDLCWELRHRLGVESRHLYDTVYSGRLDQEAELLPDGEVFLRLTKAAGITLKIGSLTDSLG